LRASVSHLDHVGDIDRDQEAIPAKLHRLMLAQLLVDLKEAVLAAAVPDDLARGLADDDGGAFANKVGHEGP